MAEDKIRQLMNRIAIAEGYSPSDTFGKGLYRTCEKWKEVQSKKLRHPVKRCSKYGKGEIADIRASAALRNEAIAKEFAQHKKDLTDRYSEEELLRYFEAIDHPKLSSVELDELINNVMKGSGKYRTCDAWQEVPSVYGHPVRRCKDYQGSGMYYDCVEDQEVMSRALGHPVKRCKRYGPMMVSRGRAVSGGIVSGGCCHCMGSGLGPSPRGGDLANKRAAARSPWLKFLRQFRLEHPELNHDQPMLMKLASAQYHSMQ